MTPAPEQDVAALVAFAGEMARYFENRPTDGEDSAHWSNVANAETSRKIATALSTLAAKLDWSFHALADETKRHLECEAASEARATALEGERDEAIKDRDAYYSDGLKAEDNWIEQESRAVQAEAQLARAREALELILDNDNALYCLAPADAKTVTEIARSLPAPADGRGDQMGASASCTQEPISGEKDAIS